MAFKTMKQYEEERYGGLFLLRNDHDFADVIFLYRSEEDVLIGDVHYIKSADYTGYVECNGHGCPACAKGIRVQTKLFIPLYNIAENEVQFWDRTARFQNQLVHDVFSRYPNPSEYVFRITREGAAGDVNTKYNITAVGNNKLMSYSEILAKNQIIMPDYMEKICRPYSNPELFTILNTANESETASQAGWDSNLPNYQVSARKSTTSAPSVPPVPPAASIPTEADEELPWSGDSNSSDSTSPEEFPDITEPPEF